MSMAYSDEEAQLLGAVGTRIRDARTTRSLSQERLAHLCNLHRTYISSVERGERNISIINLRRIARSLGLTLRDLLTHVEQDTHETR